MNCDSAEEEKEIRAYRTPLPMAHTGETRSYKPRTMQLQSCLYTPTHACHKSANKGKEPGEDVTVTQYLTGRLGAVRGSATKTAALVELRWGPELQSLQDW